VLERRRPIPSVNYPTRSEEQVGGIIAVLRRVDRSSSSSSGEKKGNANTGESNVKAKRRFELSGAGVNMLGHHIPIPRRNEL
jgi:hypothetical protein